MARHMESRGDRRARARALARFFAAGAVLSTTVLIVPGWEQMQAGPIGVTVLLAALAALTLYTGGERMGRGVFHAFTGCGTVLIAACQVYAGGGSPTAMYAMLYIWVILHCSLFFEPRIVVAHLTSTTLAHVVALHVAGETDGMAPQLALTLVTQVAAALVVGSLASRQRALADTDSLTGLGNRRAAERALEWAIDRSRRAVEARTCVAVFDLDGFKELNDRFGHAAGDVVLAELAASWREQLRSTDHLARTGGDEFLLVLTDCGIDEAERIVRRMTAMPEGVACSAGLARWIPDESATALVRRADEALYRAKADGPVAIAPDAAGGQVTRPA